MESLSTLILTTFLCLGLILWAISLKRHNTLILTNLKAKEIELFELKKEFGELEERIAKLSDFNKSMDKSNVTTKLQTKRNQDHQNVHTPEKYQYLISLTQKGMKAEEIASILSISEYEARQLVSLAKISTNAQRVS